MRSQTDTPPHLPALTSLRFVAAAMVFVYHIREMLRSDWVYFIAPGMLQGVSFFFVLSGFVLTHAYSGREFSRRRFFVARFARIWPLHAVCMLLVVALLPLRFARGQDVGGAASLVTFALKAALLDAWAPVRAALSSWNSVSWSISAEMAFYAAFPWLLAALMRRPALTVAAAAAASLAVYGVGLALNLPVYSPEGDAATLLNLGYAFPLARGFEFTLGMAACLVWRRWVAPAGLSSTVWSAVEAAALTGAALWVFFAIPALVAAATGAPFVWLRSSGSCFVFAALLVVVASGRGFAGRLLARPLPVALGEASFAFYLVHVLVLRVVEYHFVGPLAALVFIAATAALGLAFVLHRRVEIPMRRTVLALADGPRGLPSGPPRFGDPATRPLPSR